MMESQFLECHKFFNMLNNNHPMYYVDFRSPINISTATHVLITNDYKIIDKELLLKSSILDILSSIITNRTNITLVFFTDTGFDTSILEDTINAIRSQILLNTGSVLSDSNVWSRMRDLKLLFIDRVIERYGACKDLFRLNDVSTTSVRRYRSKYHPTEIIPGFLFLGDSQNGGDGDSLRALHITHVVDATGLKMSEATAISLGIQYLPVKIWDHYDADIAAHFPTVIKFIEDAISDPQGGAVLVHCAAGISRSAALVLAYLIHSRTFPTLAEAIAYVVSQRGQVAPNKGFRSQLMAYERSLLGSSSFLGGDDEFVSSIKNASAMWAEAMSETDYERVPIPTVMLRSMARAAAACVDYEETGCDVPPTPAAVKPKFPYLKKNSRKVGSARIQTGSDVQHTGGDPSLPANEVLSAAEPSSLQSEAAVNLR